MRDIWNAIKSIFVNDAHSIISKRGKEILAEQQKEYTFIPNPKTSRTHSDMTDTVIGVNGKRRRVETDYNKIFNNQREMKREMKQTAVEWYENEIDVLFEKYDDKEISKSEFMIMKHNLFYPAKEMEKEKHEKFNKFLNDEKKLGISDLKTVERIQWYYNTYFNETFNTNEK